MTPLPSSPALAAIKTAAAKQGIAWQPLAAVSHFESGLRPDAIGDGGHAFGLFQNNNAGGTITGDPNPRRFLNPNVSANYTAAAIKRLGIQGEAPQQQVADIVNRYERPAKPLPEIAGAQSYLAQLGQQSAAPTLAPSAPVVTQPTGLSQAYLGTLQGGLDLQQQFHQRALNTLGKSSGTSPLAPVAPNLAALTAQQPAQAQAVSVNLKSKTPHAAESDPQVAKVIELARHFLGTPYHFGGASPKTGFDCSGLLQFVWGQNGVKIPRTSEEQFHAGTPVPKGQIKPGDAVFFVHSDGDVGHVGMAIGNGQYIESPHTGDVVKIAKLADATNFIGARRFS